MAPPVTKDVEVPDHFQPFQQPGVKMVGGGGGPGVWAAGGGLAVTFMAVGGAVGAILLVVVGVWAARRWAGRKNSEERQQILLWPGAGAQPCSFQTREIRFTLPPSMAPLAAAASEHENQPDGGGDGPAPHSGVTSLSGSGGGSGGGGSSGSSSTQDFASPSSSSLASLGSLDAIGGGVASEARRSSITDMRRRSLQGYSLGTLNPELYRIPDHLDDPGSYPPGHLGRVFLTLHYQQETEKLQVGLLRIRNLPSRTLGSNNACDPYVRLSVLPDERRYLQTKQKKKTCNPVFDEHFGFHIPLRCVSERSLRVSVFDGGRHKRQAAIGHVIYPLAQVPADSAAAVAASNGSTTNNIIVRDLSREDESVPSNDLGEILVSLTFNDNLHRLSITVFQAKGVKVNDGEVVSWVKVSLMNQRRAVKTKKTTVVAACDEPQYNESFHFRPPPALEGVHLTLQLYMASSSNSKGRLVGRVIIGSFMFARGRALNHWNEVLSTPKEPIQFWHSLTE